MGEINQSGCHCPLEHTFTSTVATRFVDHLHENFAQSIRFDCAAAAAGFGDTRVIVVVDTITDRTSIDSVVAIRPDAWMSSPKDARTNHADRPRKLQRISQACKSIVLAIPSVHSSCTCTIVLHSFNDRLWRQVTCAIDEAYDAGRVKRTAQDVKIAMTLTWHAHTRGRRNAESILTTQAPTIRRKRTLLEVHCHLDHAHSLVPAPPHLPPTQLHPGVPDLTWSIANAATPHICNR